MNTGAVMDSSMGAAQCFELPQGWTHRRVAEALANEWLEPFRPAVVVKSARWVLQAIVEKPADRPLWEAGITTEEYEHRLAQPDLVWAVRAKAGRNRAIILARLKANEKRPGCLDVVCAQGALPETLFDPAKLAPFLESRGRTGTQELVADVLADHDLRVVTLSH